MDSPFNTYKRLQNHYLFNYCQNAPQTVDHFIFCTQPTDCSQIPVSDIHLLLMPAHLSNVAQGFNFNNSLGNFLAAEDIMSK